MGLVTFLLEIASEEEFFLEVFFVCWRLAEDFRFEIQGNIPANNILLKEKKVEWAISKISACDIFLHLRIAVQLQQINRRRDSIKARYNAFFQITKVAWSASESNTCTKIFFDEVQDSAIEFSAWYAGCYAARATTATASLRMRTCLWEHARQVWDEKGYEN